MTRGGQGSTPMTRPQTDDTCFRSAIDGIDQKGRMPRVEKSPTESEGQVHVAEILESDVPAKGVV